MDTINFHKLVKDIITALYFAHKNNFIHGDLKPENIFIDKDKEGNITFYIGDWGGSLKL